MYYTFSALGLFSYFHQNVVSTAFVGVMRARVSSPPSYWHYSLGERFLKEDLNFKKLCSILLNITFPKVNYLH